MAATWEGSTTVHMPLPGNVREATSGEFGFRGNLGLSTCFRRALRGRTVALGSVRSVVPQTAAFAAMPSVKISASCRPLP